MYSFHPLQGAQRLHGSQKMSSQRLRALLLFAAASVSCGAAPAQPAAQRQAASAAQPESLLARDIWVMRPQLSEAAHTPPFPGGDAKPAQEPALTAASFAQLRAMPCVQDVAFRRLASSGFAVRGSAAEPLESHSWTFEPSLGLLARGWVLHAGKPSGDAHYLSASFAEQLKLPKVGERGQTITQVSSFAMTTTRVNGGPVSAPVRTELLIDTPQGKVKSRTHPYGGSFSADPAVLKREPAPLVIRFGTLFTPTDKPWTRIAQWEQSKNDPVVYVRMKPRLKTGEYNTCKSLLERHMKGWEANMPGSTWAMVPLKY